MKHSKESLLIKNSKESLLVLHKWKIGSLTTYYNIMLTQDNSILYDYIQMGDEMYTVRINNM